MNVKLTVGRTAIAAPTTADDLPDVDTPSAVAANARFLWTAVRKIADQEGSKQHVLNGVKGHLTEISLTEVLSDAWDGYDRDPRHAPSGRVRSAITKYLDTTGNLTCLTRRGNAGGLWWVRDEWNPELPAQAMPRGLTPAERKLSKEEAGENLPPAATSVSYMCRVPGCGRAAEKFGKRGFGIHLQSAHQLRAPDYERMVAGETPWPGTKDATESTEETPRAVTTSIALTAEQAFTSLQAVLNDYNRLRSLTVDNDLVAENTQLRAEMAELRKHNAELRQFKAGVDRAMGRR